MKNRNSYQADCSADQNIVRLLVSSFLLLSLRTTYSLCLRVISSLADKCSMNIYMNLLCNSYSVSCCCHTRAMHSCESKYL
jgi:hypothetical protein